MIAMSTHNNINATNVSNFYFTPTYLSYFLYTVYRTLEENKLLVENKLIASLAKFLSSFFNFFFSEIKLLKENVIFYYYLGISRIGNLCYK